MQQPYVAQTVHASASPDTTRHIFCSRQQGTLCPAAFQGNAVSLRRHMPVESRICCSWHAAGLTAELPGIRLIETVLRCTVSGSSLLHTRKHPVRLSGVQTVAAMRLLCAAALPVCVKPSLFRSVGEPCTPCRLLHAQNTVQLSALLTTRVQCTEKGLSGCL